MSSKIMLYENNSGLKDFSRSLRKSQTDAEKLLWIKLRGRQLDACKFYRQFAIDNYILDFYCHDRKLAIELDGNQHKENREYDHIRTEYLEQRGIKVIRFWNNEVLKDIDGVLQVILDALKN